MAAKTTALSLILIVSLLSLSSTKTIATFINPLTLPSCASHIEPIKCYIDYKAAFGAKAAAEAGLAANAISFAVNMINAAKTSCSGALLFLNSMKGGLQSNAVVTCTNTFNVAINYLGKASTAMQGKTDLSKSAAIQVQKSVNIAVQNVLKCTTTGSKSPEVKNLAAEPVKLCNIVLSFCKGVAA